VKRSYFASYLICNLKATEIAEPNWYLNLKYKLINADYILNFNLSGTWI